VLLEQNDEWLLQHRYMLIDGMAELASPETNSELAQLPPIAA
jgi:putative transposase